MKKQLTKLALTAALGLALTLLACEDKEKKQTPAETQTAEPAAAPPPQEAAATTLTDSRDKKTYKTVKIGTQTWMAENLNYEAKGSKCYDNKPANCQKYGRLYDWNTAMNSCPSGWHLPTNEEWKKLRNFAGGPGPTDSKLMATNGWNKDKVDNGTDDFGFSALPAGTGFGDSFEDIGNYGGWWSGTEYESLNVDAYREDMGSSSGEEEHSLTNPKGSLLSVRCIKD